MEEKESSGTMANIKSVKIHEEYRRQNSGGKLTPLHDIAIITLDRPITRYSVEPICLPPSSSSSSDVTEAVVAGWGITTRTIYGKSQTKLRYAKLETYDVDECRSKYENFVRGDKIDINTNMICAGNNTLTNKNELFNSN